MLFLPREHVLNITMKFLTKLHVFVAQRKQNGDEKPAKPPKMPKPAKEPKPPRPRKEPKPKEPKVAKPKPAKPAQERKPRAPRDPQSARQRPRPKKGSLGPSESNSPSPSLAGEDFGDGYGGGPILENGYSLDGGDDHGVNGDHMSTSRPSTVSSDS